MKVNVKITDTAAVRQRLRDVRAAMRGTPLEQALHAAAAPIMESARSKAPPGAIRNAIKVIKVLTTEKAATAWIGITSKARPFHALFVEMGTGLRFRKGKETKKKRRGAQVLGSRGSTGRMPARPFLRPAMDEQAGAAREAFARSLAGDIERVGKR